MRPERSARSPALGQARTNSTAGATESRSKRRLTTHRRTSVALAVRERSSNCFQGFTLFVARRTCPDSSLTNGEFVFPATEKARNPRGSAHARFPSRCCPFQLLYLQSLTR